MNKNSSIYKKVSNEQHKFTSERGSELKSEKKIVSLVDVRREEEADYYGEEGCCLTCDWGVECSWCANCKCHECGWYKKLEMPEEKRKGYCDYLKNKLNVVVDEIKAETEKAYLVRIGKKEIWIAKQGANRIENINGRPAFDIELWLLRKIGALNIGVVDKDKQKSFYYNRNIFTSSLQVLFAVFLIHLKTEKLFKTCALYAQRERREKEVWNSNISGFSEESGENSKRQQISQYESFRSDRNYLRYFFYELSARAGYREGTGCDNRKKEKIVVQKGVVA